MEKEERKMLHRLASRILRRMNIPAKLFIIVLGVLSIVFLISGRKAPGSEILISVQRLDGNSYVINKAGQEFLWNHTSQSQKGWSDVAGNYVLSGGFEGQGQILVQDEKGVTIRNLSGDGQSDYGPSWSPDGSQIVFTSLRDGNWNVWVINSDGSNLRNLTGNKYSSSQFASWSPTGDYISFVSFTDNTTMGGLYLMNADGTDVKQLAISGTIAPVWSPTGEQIAFVAGDHLFVSDLQGNAIRYAQTPPQTRMLTYLSQREVAVSYFSSTIVERTQVIDLVNMKTILDVEGTLIQ